MSPFRFICLSGFFALLSFSAHAEEAHGDEASPHDIAVKQSAQTRRDLEEAQHHMEKGNLHEAVAAYLNASDSAKIASLAAQEHHASEGSLQSAQYAANLAKLSAKLHQTADPKVTAEELRVAADHHAAAGERKKAIEAQQQSLEILAHVASHAADNGDPKTAHLTYVQLADGYANLANLSDKPQKRSEDSFDDTDDEGGSED